jgi:hypothetical protein
MESWPGQEKRVQMVLAAPIEEATPELAFEATQRFDLQVKRTQREQALKASQLAGLRQLSENPRPLEEPERLAMSLLLAWRSGRQALVSFAPGQPLSIPSPD